MKELEKLIARYKLELESLEEMVGEATDKNYAARLNSQAKVYHAIIPDLNAIEDKWIPVSERMPEFNESVLVFCRVYGRFLATYEHIGDFKGEKFGNWRDFKGHLGILPPTHWMPLPTPPKG